MGKKGLADTIESLKARGYVEDFNLRGNCIECRAGKFSLFANEFKVDSVFRFDEMSDPADQAVLYAISSEKTGMKGILVNSFGVYSDPITNEMVAALQLVEQGAERPAA